MIVIVMVTNIIIIVIVSKSECKETYDTGWGRVLKTYEGFIACALLTLMSSFQTFQGV